ncbi:TPA: hypothetical protein ACN76M_001987 [Klebsiella pneumoniae]|uniref:hypothetical protein n=1 Tax=Klebsiella pneumoniae TaxID=573 RepID=UPI000C175765|nr:hypothetical protein [Klebsiella pneumoniae]ATR41253.1 hypothetical protein CTI63_07195 [Klebsiella pneumoniae]ATR46572.1 hypothetical protein CTI65_07195 [Klebsiella pneumoniae]MBJ6737417.1 hypothetical protein [Klebsiella pneumoniae]MDE4748688.1 hypothetical protein [Klebsiella pneumoniae]MDW7533102.1 hypothetical protein [Klebsiella pneumoniae]
MTITLQAVNELIASLESAGELSIREQKFLKLAKAFKQLAEENVGLRPLIAENWNMRDLLRQLMAGRPGGVYFNKWEKLIVRVLNETPATDRIVAGIKADAIDEAAVELDRVDTVASTRVIGFKLREFAKQLREGAK